MLTVVSELRPLQLLSYLTVFLLVTLTDAKRDLKSACLTCQQITENFNKVKESFLNILIAGFCNACLVLSAFFTNRPLLVLTLFPVFCTFESFLFRALKEQQSRTLAEATRPGRRENSPNMRQGDQMQPASGHSAPAAGQQISVSFQLETGWFVKDLNGPIKGTQRHWVVGKYASDMTQDCLFSQRDSADGDRGGSV